MSVSLDRTWTWWLFGIALLTVCTYGAALNNQLVPFDDNTLIYMNAAVAHLSFANVWHVFSSYDPELYIPLTFLLYQCIHLVAGFTPGAYHAVSLLLHVVNAGLVAWIIWQLTGRRSVTLVVTVLFALHPLQSEAVLWAAAMKDILSSTGGLLSLGCYLQWRSTGSRTWWRWCIVFFLLGLLAKVSIVLLPVLFLLIDREQHRPVTRQMILEKWPFFLLSLLFIAIAIAGKTAVIGSAGVMATVLLPFKATAFYLQKILWPAGLSLLYPQSSPVSLQDPLILVSIAIVILLVCAAWFFRTRFRLLTLGILWYLLLLLPSFSTFYKNEFLYFASNRYAYLPSIGLFLVIALLAVTVWDRWKLSRIPLTILALMITAGSVWLDHRQVEIWHDSKALFANVIELYPLSPVAYNNEATEFQNGPAALPLLQKAIALDPYFILGYRNIATYYQHNNQPDRLKQTYEQGLTMLLQKPHPTTDDLSLLYDYAEYKDDNGDREGAIALLQQAIMLHPDFSTSYYNLGVKEEKYGQLDVAKPALEKAQSLNANDPDTLYHLAAVDAATGDLPSAATLLQRLVAIDPNYAEAANHLADIEKILQK